MSALQRVIAALPNFDQQAILKLLTDLSGICASHPGLEVALDTFQDFDRGYHPRLQACRRALKHS